MKKNKEFCKERQNPHILVAPLDWGLGHATRCIPIIRELIYLGCEVYIVADKQAFSLLKKEFPQSVILRYKGYGIKYSRHKKFFSLKLISQVPAVIFKIWKEKRWLQKTVKAYHIDAIISDNRFGMYHKNIPSVYITHQLCIKTGNRLIESVAQKIHYYFIKKYKLCWVPDQQENGLAGDLSHPRKLPLNFTYLGLLSRFTPIPSSREIYDLAIILSGPEPQRTIFEGLIFGQLKDLDGNIILIRGLPGQKTKPDNFRNVVIENHLPANEMNTILAQSKLVLCRSGYTSVMDLSLLQKKAILIPTPGQTEQEYLGKYLFEKHYFFSEPQENFSIKKAIEKVQSFHFESPAIEPERFKKIVRGFVFHLKSENPK